MRVRVRRVCACVCFSPAESSNYAPLASVYMQIAVVNVKPQRISKTLIFHFLNVRDVKKTYSLNAFNALKVKHSTPLTLNLCTIQACNYLHTAISSFSLLPCKKMEFEYKNVKENVQMSLYSFTVVVNQEVRGNQTILISKTDQSEFFTERFQSGPGRRKLLFFLFLFLPTVLWEISSCSNKKTAHLRSGFLLLRQTNPGRLRPSRVRSLPAYLTSCFFFFFFPNNAGVDGEH